MRFIYMSFLMIVLPILFSGCSSHQRYITVDKFSLPIDLKVKNKQTYWYKKEGTSFIGISDFNTTVGGLMYFDDKRKKAHGKVMFLVHKNRYIIKDSRVYNCDTKSRFFDGNLTKDGINEYLILPAGIYCFNPVKIKSNE